MCGNKDGGKPSSVEIRRRQALICGNKESVLGGKPSSVEIRNRCSEASPHLWK